MYKDGFSLPSLAEVILYQFSIEGFDEYLRKKPPSNYDSEIYDQELQSEINNYKHQDEQANRRLDNFIDIDGFKRVLQKDKYRCHYCWTKA